jgi:hypothetical protein
MDTQKLPFITVELTERLKALTESIQPNWGVMSAQEMIEQNGTKLYTLYRTTSCL